MQNSSNITDDSSIILNNLTKSFLDSGQKQLIFHDLNLYVKSGELVVLYGRSGSGKSTLLNLLGAIDHPDSGQIKLFGKDITAYTELEKTIFRRKNIGFIFQSYNLIPTLTVLENVLLPLELLKIRPKWLCKNKSIALLATLGLSHKIHTYPDQLSGGEQQRVAIARALVHDPQLILADEPTGNLDIDTGKDVLSFLDQLVRENGKTMIMATHSQEVIGIADRLLKIQKQTLIPLEQ